MSLLYDLSVVTFVMSIVKVFWCGAQGQGPTSKNLVSWGFTSLILYVDLIYFHNLTTGKLNRREKNGETLEKASIERVTLTPRLDKEAPRLDKKN